MLSAKHSKKMSQCSGLDDFDHSQDLNHNHYGTQTMRFSDRKADRFHFQGAGEISGYSSSKLIPKGSTLNAIGSVTKQGIIKRIAGKNISHHIK